MFLCDLTSSFSGEDYPRFCTNGPSSSLSSSSSLSLTSYFFDDWWLILVDLQLRLSYLMATLCLLLFTLHWRCVLCPDYFDSQTLIALKTRWWCSCVVLNWRIGPWASQMKICPNVLTVLHWSTKNIARRVFFDCHAMTHRIPLFEYQLSDAQKNMLGHSDQKFDPFNCTPLFLLVLGDVHLWRHHPRGNGQAKYIEWWHNWTGERDIPVYCITPSHCIESRETMSTLGQPTQCLRLKV